jgi:NAD(P)-dependent dehydrogenase (short-subunit alcohol dehydrogenase family)
VRPAAFSLEGKRILVTGASSGIGREIAVACSREGAGVVATGRDERRLAETLEMLTGTGNVTVAGDLRSPDGRKVVASAAGVIDGLVHCAGTTDVRLFRQVDARYIDEDFSINFDAPVLLTQVLLASRQIAQGGSIVFIGSFAAHIGAKGSSIYSASKGALIPVARALAQEVGARQQVRVNVINASYVETPMTQKMKEGVLAEGESLYVPPLGPGRAADVANGAVFLLAEASRWITRSILRIDGGLGCQVSYP